MYVQIITIIFGGLDKTKSGWAQLRRKLQGSYDLFVQFAHARFKFIGKMILLLMYKKS